MPIRIAELTQERRRIDVKVGRETMWVYYKPHEMTPAKEAIFSRSLTLNRIRDESGEEATTDDELPALQMFADVVVDWDVEGPLYARVPLTDDEGTTTYEIGDELVAEGVKIAPTPDNLLHISSRLIALTMQAIQKDLSLDPKADKPTNGGSFRRVK